MLSCNIFSRRPAGWPADIPGRRGSFNTWALTNEVTGVWIAAPRHEADCVEICNWMSQLAPEHRGVLRPAGTCWSWSPVVFPVGFRASCNDVMIDFTASMKSIAINVDAREVTVGPGTLIEDLLKALDAQGYTIASYPGCGKMSVGGCVAVAAKGSLVSATRDAPEAQFGSIANLVTRFTIVSGADARSGGGAYRLRELRRGFDSDADLLLVGVGRTLMTSLTLKIMPQFNVRVTCDFDHPASSLFAAESFSPSTSGRKTTFADLVNATGRVSAIWFPFTDTVWLRNWSYCPTKPATSRKVEGPYNYPYQDNQGLFATRAVETVLGVPHRTYAQDAVAALTRPLFGPRNIFETTTNALTQCWFGVESKLGILRLRQRLFTWAFAQFSTAYIPIANKKDNCTDLWGASHNVLQFSNAKLRISSHGITIAIPRDRLQAATNASYTIAKDLIASYQRAGMYPMNGQIEWRASSMDDGASIGIEDSEGPALSVGHMDRAEGQKFDCLLLIEVIYFPNTPGFNAFVSDLQLRLERSPELSGANGVVTTDWSKQFATSSRGGEWDSEADIRRIRTTFPRWNDALDAQARHDPDNLFVTDFNKWVFNSSDCSS